MPAPVTANTIPVTQHAQQAFEQAVNDLNVIASGVFDSQQMLTSSAMISDAGRVFGGAVVQWTNSFVDIRNTLQGMADTLGATWKQIQQNEQNNADLAAHLSAATPGGSPSGG